MELECLDLLQGMKGLLLATHVMCYGSFSWTFLDMKGRGSCSSGGNQTGLNQPESGFPSAAPQMLEKLQLDLKPRGKIKKGESLLLISTRFG